MTPVRATCLLPLILMAATAQGRDDKEKNAAALRSVVLKSDSLETKSVAYKNLFTELGLAGLKPLIDDTDTSLALQAAWEVHKKVVKREKPIADRTEWVYEEKPLKEFLQIFTRRTGVEPPSWWRNTLLNVDVYPKQFHAFRELDKGRPESPKYDTVKDQLIVSDGKESIKISKAAIEKEVDVQQTLGSKPPAVIGKEQSFFASPPPIGYPYKLIGIDSKTSKILWKADVWASRQGAYGGRGFHDVQITRHKDTVIVYGVEPNGIYAEAFDAKTGESQFRFCSCYWFKFSEAWGLK